MCRASCSLLMVLVLPGVRAAAAEGQLIAFAGAGNSSVARHFATVVPRLGAVAADLGVELRVIDARSGLPEEVHVTPLIIFQNHLGRSVYQGRYMDIDRIRTFVRTAARVAQAGAEDTRTGVPVWSHGRARIATPLKITALTGTQPPEFDADRFEAEAQRAIVAGFDRLRRVESVTLGRSDRLFYMDFHPWRSDDGRLAVAVKLFSQWNCKVPVFEQAGAGAMGPWADRAEVFGRAAATLEQAMIEHIAAANLGDGFDVVAADVPVKTWAALGLDLPEPPDDAPQHRAAAALPRAWRVLEDDIDFMPVLQFRFAPPLDSYAGEVFNVSGALTLSAGLAVTSLAGAFDADPTSVSMGEPLLDKTLQTELFLDSGRFPNSRFVIERAVGEGHVAWGRAAAVSLMGRFELKGVTVPLTLDATLEPVVDGAGAALLNLKGRFDLDIRPFDLEGPDGPKPATHTMRFDFDLFLEPADPQRPTP